jgi:hypothetical protein
LNNVSLPTLFTLVNKIEQYCWCWIGCNNIVQYCWQLWTMWAAKHCSILFSSTLQQPDRCWPCIEGGETRWCHADRCVMRKRTGTSVLFGKSWQGAWFFLLLYFSVEHLNIQRWKVRYFCVLNFASLQHYFTAKKINNNKLYFGHVMIFCY